MTNQNRKQHRKQPQIFAFCSTTLILVSWICVVTNVPAQEPNEKATIEMSQLGAKDKVILPPGLTNDQIEDGWIALFDGETLFGWKAVTDANWRVEDGEIRVNTGTKKGLLRTTAQFDDYELRFEFKADPETNSGVFLRTSPSPNNPAVDCYESNIAPASNPFPTGSLVGRVKTSGFHQHEGWNTMTAIVDGGQVSISINGTETSSCLDPPSLGRGYIGLQFNSGAVAFKNIHLRPRNVLSVPFDEDLTHWKTDQKMDSKFSVTAAGELQIKNGKGQIETKDQYAELLFSMKCKTNATGLNSGVFFRCIPGDLMNGYESQIQNQFKDDDRSQPVDCGTGGIFRRVNARHVNANDNEWFCKTIVATGPHVSVWVNGLQVTDWTDHRKPHENPRKGLRLEKGSVIFQGHDPTTDILIKDVRAKEISKRSR